MTPEYVRNIAFGRAPFGRRGYQEEAVDQLLDEISAALAGGPPLTPQRLHRELPTRGGLFTRGYHPDEVDAFRNAVRAEFGF